LADNHVSIVQLLSAISRFLYQLPSLFSVFAMLLGVVSYITIRYDRWFALENWQASCQFNL